MTPITEHGIQCALDGGLIEQDLDGNVTFRWDRLPTEATHDAAECYRRWDEADRPVHMGTYPHPLLNACVDTAVKSGLYCPQDVADWLQIDVSHVYNPEALHDTFTRTAIDCLIANGNGNAMIRDFSAANGWPVSTARVATRRRRYNNQENNR